MRTPDTDLVHVAACQVSLRVGEVARNRAAALEAIFAAAAAGASIIVLPELAPSGYVFESPAEARAAAEPADGPTVTEWAAAAADLGVIIIGGFAELGEDGLLYNSAVLADPGGAAGGVPQGAPVGRRERLLHARHRAAAGGGHRVRPDRHDDLLRRRVPRVGPAPALAGADLLAVPTNWPAEPVPPGERPMVVANVQAAAFANRMFVAAACRVGAERGVSWVGGSLIAGPDGYPLAGPAGADDPELVLAGCDLRRPGTRRRPPQRPARDRRPALYG